MRVLVTGGNGFLGRHVCDILSSKGHVPFPCGSVADLRSADMAYVVFHDTQPDVVIHAACPMGGGNVKYAGEKEADLLRDMLLINTNVLEKCQRFGVKRVITIGSVCEYPDAEDMFDGDEPLTAASLWAGLPHSSHRAYGLAKRMLALQGRTYATQYDMRVTHLILSNLYGPGDKLNELSHFIPATIKKMVENPDQVVIWGDGEPRRDFVYVEDAAREIVRHAEHFRTDSASQIYNVCTGGDCSIAYVVDEIAKLLNYKGQILWDHTKPNGQMSRHMMQTISPLQYTPFKDGLRKTIEWIQQQLTS